MRRPLTNRYKQWYRVALQSLPNFIQDALEFSPLAIELVDKRDPGNLIFVSLTPDRLTLRLDPFAGAKDDNCTVEYPQTAFDLGCEIDVPRRVEQVDVHIPPIERHASCINRDAAFLLLGVTVVLPASM